MDTRILRTLAFAAAVSHVAACGGGGDDGATTGDSSTTSGTDAPTTGAASTSDESTTTASTTTTTTASTTDLTTGDPSSTTDATATDPSDPVCGDGVVEASEECDDGNDVDDDACLSTCVAATCGDGVLHTDVEACDDGNQSDDDICLNTCVEATCGDGFLAPGEACDDGNQVEDDECTNACALPTCGDAVKQAGEECDDGNDDSADACLNTCLNAICGDNVVQAGVEACDDANGVDTDDCPGTCQPASCGDGFVQEGVEACDDGNMLDSDACLKTCQLASCGDGFVQQDVESCDDGNLVDDDGCQSDCGETPGAANVVSGWYHNCALTKAGDVHCWGRNNVGQLGQGNVVAIGDDELPNKIPKVDLGAKALSLVAGEYHTCAIVEGGKVRCWGRSNVGQLGLASVQSIGDNEQPWTVADVPIGAQVEALAAGRSHTCALVKGGKVRCWGGGNLGQLGYGNINNIGDNETPASAGDVPLGGVALQVTAGENFSCAIVDNGKVRCWGQGANGALGYGNVANIGDDELPSSVDHVFLGTPVKLIASGRRHTCALATDESVHCWGLNSNGQLGLGTVAALGDNETPSIGGFINFAGGKVISLALGYSSSCALLDSGKVRCWGNNTYGQLGQGNVVQIGDNESPNTIEPIDIGPSITHISANWHHVCTRGQDSGVRCFGRSEYGQLGYANILNVGDDELPSSVGKVAFLP